MDLIVSIYILIYFVSFKLLWVASLHLRHEMNSLACEINSSVKYTRYDVQQCGILTSVDSDEPVQQHSSD